MPRSTARPNLHTLATHAGRHDFRELGVHAPPVDRSTTYPIGDLDQATASLDRLVEGRGEAVNPVYARLHSPTVARWEGALAEMEGAEAAVAFSTGMAALTAVVLAAKAQGRHIVAVRPLYGGSDHLLDSGLLGVDITWATADTIEESIRRDTCLVIVETPANPSLALVDIERVVEQAGNVPVMVDSTFATPVLQNPLRHGAAIVLHSATKFLGGHGDVMAGVVATTDEWAARIRQVRIATGAILDPFAAYLLHRGLPTLPIRVERAQATACVLAQRLSEHELVSTVRFPGLPGEDPRGIIGRQMRGPGSLIAFEPKGDPGDIGRLLKALELITPAVSLGSTDTLIQHPFGLTHRVVDAGALEQAGVSANLVRLSVGLEGVDDLWNDLEQALASTMARRPPLRARETSSRSHDIELSSAI